MKARTIEEGAYLCPACGRAHSGAPKIVPAWVIEPDDLDPWQNSHFVTRTPVVEIEVGVCPTTNISFLLDEAGHCQPAYQCSSCEVVYPTQEEAQECCQELSPKSPKAGSM